jgi:hypothetical protein
MNYKKITGVVLTMAMVVFSFADFSTAHAAVNSISTCAALQNIGSTGLNADYVLTGDIDCSGIANFSPIGTFTGTLDGQGHTISNIFIHGGLFSDQIGLFSATDGAVIRNLSISNSDVWGYTRVGTLVGNASNTVITNVSVSSGTTLYGLGGGTDNVGGLVGYASNTIISYSHTSVPLNVGGSNVGGLVGSSTNGSIISKSYSTGQVSPTSNNGSNFGGLVGNNDSSTIIDSYTQSYILSGIFSQNSIGGLVGLNNGSTALINRSYSAHGFNVVGTPQGLVGAQTNSATTTNSFWDTSTGPATSAAGTGKNTSQMQTQGTFVSGWDFTNVWVIGGYPTLRAGDVTAPAAPSSVTAVATGSNVHLAWTNPGDVDFAGIDIYQSLVFSPSNALVGSALITGTTGTSANDNSLADGTYNYSIMSYDTAGNYSLPARVSVRVDTTPTNPPLPSGTSTVGRVVTLSWTNPADTDFANVTIVRNATAYPSNPSDGTTVIAGLVGTSYPNTVPADGTYYYSVFAYDNTGNVSTGAHLLATVDTVLPVLATVTPVGSYTNDSTPNFTFSSTKLGGITYGGSCSSATSVATSGSNTITLNTLTDGTYSNCTMVVRDAFGNNSLLFTIPTFTVDTLAPTLTAGTEVSSNTLARNAVYTFSTTEPGTYTLSGCAGSIDSAAHVVRFAGLAPGNYSCTLTETDFANNVSNTLTLQSFTIAAVPQGHIPSPVDVVSTDGKLGFSIDSTKTGAAGDNTFLLKLNADPKTVQGYSVSTEPTFKDVGILNYDSNVSFNVPAGIDANTIYLRYYSTTGKPSDTFKQSLVAPHNPVTTISKKVKVLQKNISPKTAPVKNVSKNKKAKK